MSLRLGETLIAGSPDFTTVLFALFPVGAIYQGNMDECPLATLMDGTTWEKVATGRVLQGADSSHARGTNIAQGLPNITGSQAGVMFGSSYTSSGALSTGGSGATAQAQSSATSRRGLNFNASSSNTIYGSNSNVQPPAYAVNIWERKS